MTTRLWGRNFLVPSAVLQGLAAAETQTRKGNDSTEEGRSLPILFVSENPICSIS